MASVFSTALLRIKIQIVFPVLLLAYTAFRIRIAAYEIGLHHLYGVCMIFLFQQRSIRHGNQVFMLADIGNALPDNVINGSNCPVDLIFKIHRVVNHTHIRMAAPGSQRQIIFFARNGNIFIARRVAEIVGKFCPLCTGDKMQHGIIPCHNLFRRLSKIRKDLFELLYRNICKIIKNCAIVDDHDFFFRHGFCTFQCQLFLVQLIGYNKILELLHAHTAGKRTEPETGNQLCCSFRDGNDFPSVFAFKFLQDPGDQRCFACSRTAGKYYSDYSLLTHIILLLLIVSYTTLHLKTAAVKEKKGVPKLFPE